MIVTLMISVIPYSYFLQRSMVCGPFAGGAPIDVVLTYINSLPGWIGLCFGYLRSSLLLWLLVILSAVYAIYLGKHEDILGKELAASRRRLIMDVKEKQEVIRENGIVLADEDTRGADLFKSWMMELGAMGSLYWRKFDDCAFNDLLELMELDDAQIRDLMVEWRTPDFPVPDEHIEFFQNAITEKTAEYNRGLLR